ncbi:MAG TPA: adenylate/guanylate cyclase domain-containing protein, partial [Bradyrhizobium sp.]|nr:adenylate/guanylate cyclase domain-containing protein [Bradyrhizobium sp.]
MILLTPWGGKKREVVSSDFDFALTQEILRTELIRIKALIGTAAFLGAMLWTIYLLAPETVSRVWMGHLKPQYLYSILVPFILFEFWVHAVIKRHLELNQDVPTFRRYLGAFIETSMPTVALALHINAMGSVQALGFVVPMAYFIFIILSTLRLDFWLSTFTGFVAATELLAMAMFYHPDAPPDLFFNGARSMILLIGGMLAGAVGMQLRRQFEASIKAATARDRITNLFGQHVSPQVVERLMLEGKGAESDIRRVAVMFVDFRSFTAGARERSPQEVVDRLDGA